MQSQKDFAWVYRHGVRARGQLILVVAAERPKDNDRSPGFARVGLSVSKKYAKSAVIRNRARRCFRESFRLLRPELAAMDYILIPVAEKLHAYSMPEVRAELIRLIPKIDRKWARKLEQQAARSAKSDTTTT
jgi:ribonuclease P protein component